MNTQQLKAILANYGLVPQKRLGQNFLVDQRVSELILKAAAINRRDRVLEVGAGLGALTKPLAEQAGQILAVEKDRQLIAPLQVQLAGLNNIEIIQADILALLQNDSAKVLNFNKVVGNIPYYLSSRLLRVLLESTPKPQLIVLTVQKELARRVLAQPPKMNLLAVATQYYATVELLQSLPKNSFWPQPGVESAIIRLQPNAQIIQNSKFKIQNFFTVLRAGFSSPRKKLAGNLKTKLGLEGPVVQQMLKSCKIDQTVRAEVLNLTQWQQLARAYATIQQTTNS